MIIYIGMDDTDNKESRGTGRLARSIAAELACEFRLLGVTRHQLLVDPRVPYTSHNSSAAIALETEDTVDLPALFRRVKAVMLADFIPGSDPGLCMAVHVPQAITDFGRKAQREFVQQEEARRLAAEHGLLLEGLGGTQDGVIGALAAVGLAACGEDGRYLHIGRVRDLHGPLSVDTLLQAGVAAVQTLDGEPVLEGTILVEKLRPARRGGKPVAIVAREGDHWRPLKLG